MSIAIGIDLGTTNSCVAFYRNNQVHVIENDDGDRTTPSFVYFNEKGEHIVGKTAMNKIKTPASGIFDVKRLMGRKFKNAKLISDEFKHYPYQITTDPKGNALINVKYGAKEEKSFVKKPQEISALVLGKLVKAARDKLGSDFNNKAVITVPAYFNNDQRAATKEAGKLAGLEVLRLLNEPTAAALAYVHNDLASNCHKNIAVYDFGGGTFDISIIELKGRQIVVKSIDGDCFLGGKNIDDKIQDKFIKYIEQEYKHDITKNRRAMRRFRQSCEDLKIQLSFKESDEIVLEYIVPDVETTTLSLTRKQLEDEILKPIIDRTLKIVDSSIDAAQMNYNDIDEVLLVGGTSKIPAIQEALSRKFGPDKISKRVSLHEAVAEGAAIQAALLTSNSSEAIVEISLKDVISIPLGTATKGNKFNCLIKRNAQLPAKSEKSYKTIENMQKEMTIEVFEGDNTIASNNVLLDSMVIQGLTPAPAGDVIVTVVYSVDLDGILHVTASEKFSGKVNKLKISLNRGY